MTAQISITYKAASLEDLLATIRALKAEGVNVAPVTVTPVTVTPPAFTPQVNRSPVFALYKSLIGQNFRIAQSEAVAYGWNGALSDCPDAVKAQACRARLIQAGHEVPDEESTEAAPVVNPASVELSADDDGEF